MADVAKDPNLYHAPGIYLGMSEEEYHADTALGSTDIRLLASKPWLWQRNRLRAGSKNVTAEMKWGAAFHCRVLEGAAVFAERYAQKPAPEDFGEVGKDVLVTNAHLIEFLRGREKPTSKRTKDELVAMCREFLDCPVIYEEKLEEFKAQPRVKAGYEIDADTYQEIEDAVWQMQQNPVLAAIMQAGSLSGGAAEVSIFYEVDGIRRKCRFDYAIPNMSDGDRAYTLITDLKSFSNFRGDSAESSALDSIYRMGMDLQAVDYLNGFDVGRELFKAGAVSGEEPREHFLRDLFTAEEAWWAWIMVQKDSAYQTFIGFLNRRDQSYDRDLHFQHVEDVVRRGVMNYRGFVERHGTDALWPAPADQPLRISGALFPSWNRGF